MATIDFKSVGKKRETIIKNAITGSLRSVGIKLPLSRGTRSSGIFDMNSSLAEQFSQNLKNLILTNHGERLGLYDFGANLRPLMSELVSEEDFDSQATIRIKQAVSKYMPFVNLKIFKSGFERFNNQHVAKILLEITYDIPLANITNNKIEVVMHVM